MIKVCSCWCLKRVSIQSAYRSTCSCVYVDNAFHIWPYGINGRVEGEASRVDPEVSAAPVHDLPLEVELHLHGRIINSFIHSHNNKKEIPPLWDQ